MAFDSYVHNVLIVSGSEKGRYYFKNILLDCHYTFNTRILSDSLEARRLLLNNDTRRDKRKKVVDKIAATIILQAYLDRSSNER